MLEVTLLRLVGTGLVALGPTFLRRMSPNSPPHMLLQTAFVPGDELIARLTRDTPERMTSFVESAVRRLWAANRDRLGDIAADVHAKHLISLLEEKPLDAEAVCKAADTVRNARKKRDAIADEARRLASAVLNHGGGATELRQNGRDPLALLTLADSLFTIVLGELPFLDDILPLIVGALADEPPLPPPPGQFASSLEEAIASDKQLAAVADSLRRYASTQLVEVRNCVADYCFMDGAQVEAMQAVLVHVDEGARFRVERALNEIESHHLKTITSNLASSEREAPLAAMIRLIRAPLSAMIGDFERAIRNIEAAQRHVRLFGIDKRWPVVMVHARKLRDRAVFTEEPKYLADALQLLRRAAADLPTVGNEQKLAEAELLTAEIAITDRATGDPVSRLRFALDRAMRAGARFRALEQEEDELAAQHVEASARRLIGTLTDDGTELAAAAELYETVVEALDPTAEKQRTNVLSLAARRADSIRGAWCVIAHLAVLAENDDAVGMLASTPGGATAPTAPLALCTAADQRVARLRADTSLALRQGHDANFMGLAQRLEAAIAKLPETAMSTERALLSDQLGNLHIRIASTADAPANSVAEARRCKAAALEVLKSLAHPRAVSVARDLASLSEAIDQSSRNETRPTA